MAAQTAAGTVISIGSTGDLSSESSWTEIGEVVSISEFGRTYAEITHNPLGDRGTEKFKGSYNDGDITLQLAQDLSDAGQQALLDALDSDDAYNFQVLQNDAPSAGDPTTHVFKARVMSFTHNVDGVDSIVGSSVTLGIVSGTLDTTAAA